jgi:Mn2+/Fe2+ NRAMP family transporter
LINPATRVPVPIATTEPTATSAVAMLGTTITPYLFFWQTSGEVEEKRGVQRLSRSNLDIAIGMVWSNFTAFSSSSQLGLSSTPTTSRSKRQRVRHAPWNHL